MPPPTYLPRTVDAELDELLGGLPAVALEGPKGVGKTETAQRRASVAFRLDDPAQRTLLEADPTLLDREPGTVLIDEWQRHPPVWDHVRRAVDARAPAGRFVLTGSAVPPQAPVHSGAGRIVSVRMRPLSLAERGLATPTVSLGELLTGGRPEVAGESAVRLGDYAAEIVGSGFPGIRPLAGRQRRAQLNGYLERVVEREFPDQGRSVRRPATLRAWLAAYAAATATTASYNAILDAATAGESNKPAKTTTIAYREVLSQLWLLDPVPGWVPSLSRLTRLSQAPKHHLADPALATSLLGVGVDALLRGVDPGQSLPRDGPLLGAMFESLVTLSVRVYAQQAEARLAHLRERDGRREVDLIVERADGSVVGVEVKLGATTDDHDVRHLRWLEDRIGDRCLDRVVVTTGSHAYRRRDGIAVVPASLLGP